MSSSRKRTGEDVASTGSKSKGAARKADLNNIGESDLPEDLVFEDPYGDTYEEEDLEEVEDFEEGDEMEEGKAADNELPSVESNTDQVEVKKEVWRPGLDALGEGEELDYDPSAYIMFHSFRTEWPCLTFDFFKDNLGDNRQRVRPLDLVSIFQHSHAFFFHVSPVSSHDAFNCGITS